MTSEDLLRYLIVDRASREALHNQIAAALAAAIAAGDLPPGEPLPSTRALSTALGVSRNTVVTAYDELASEGWIAACAGSVTRVARPVAPHSNQYSTITVGRVGADCSALYCGR